MDNVDAPGLDTWQEQERVGGGIGFLWEKVNRLSKPSLTPSSNAVETYPTWLKFSTALSLLFSVVFSKEGLDTESVEGGQGGSYN